MVRHGFFTREGGVSERLYASLNCGAGSSDDPARVSENRRRCVAALGGERLCTLYQIHSNIVHVVNAVPETLPEGDALVSKAPGVVLGVLTADCAPVLLCDAEARVIGAAHAGRPGALKGIVQATVQAMARLGATPSRITAAIGPCLAQKNHELPEEWRQRFLAQAAGNKCFFIPSPRANHWLFDLTAYVQECLHRAGVLSVEALPEDTYADDARFYSYRRATHGGEPDYGRQLSAIMLGSIDIYGSEPERDSSEGYGCEVVCVVSVETGGESSEVLELVEAALDAVTLLVEIFAVFVWALGVGFWWDDDLHASALHVPPEVVAHIAFIGKQRLGLETAYQGFGLRNVGGLAAGELRPHRQPVFVGGEMDFGGQSSAGPPHSLIAGPPFPALDC